MKIVKDFSGWALLSFVMLITFSCNVVKKTSHKKTDESSIEIKTAIDTSKKAVTETSKKLEADNIIGTKETNEHTRDLNVDFGPVNSNTAASDYVDTAIGGIKVHTNGAANIILKGNGDIEISGHPKNVHYTEKGKAEKIDTSHHKLAIDENSTNTTEQKGTTVADVKGASSHTESDRSKFTFRFQWWWLLIIAAVLLCFKGIRLYLYGWWKWLLLRVFGMK